jgi:hypothetical protein
MKIEESSINHGKYKTIRCTKDKPVTDNIHIPVALKIAFLLCFDHPELVNLKISNIQIPQHIIAISNAIRANTTLRKLDMRKNKRIVGDEAKLLAEAVIASKKLEYFGFIPVKKLRENDVQVEYHLSGMKIGQAEAIVLVALLKINTTLTHLYLANNNICDGGAEAFTEFLKTNKTTTLTHLDMRQNKITDPAAAKLADAVLTNKNNEGSIIIEEFGEIPIRELLDPAQGGEINLDDRNIGPAEAIVLGKLLGEQQCTLTSLSMTNYDSEGIGTAGAVEIANGLRNNKHLTNLDISNNNIGTAGAIKIIESLGSNNLTSLDISNNNRTKAFPQGGADDSGVNAITETLRLNSRLTSLRAGGNDRATAFAILKRVVVVGVEERSKITGRFRLDLSFSNIGEVNDDEKALIERYLLWPKDGESINLLGNDFNVDFATFLASQSFISLCGLSDEDTNASYSGAPDYLSVSDTILLKAHLCLFSSLTSLDLSNCGLVVEGIKNIADALEENCTLLSLNLGGNVGCGSDEVRDEEMVVLAQPRKTDDIKAIADMLKVNTTLQVLSMYDNCIGDAGATMIANALLKENLPANRTMQLHVNVADNKISDVGAQAFITTLNKYTAEPPNWTIDVYDNDIISEANKKVLAESAHFEI